MIIFQSNLSGFYDPCPEEEKMLRIRYFFREAIHEVTVGDEEPVKIPKQCKYCSLFLSHFSNAFTMKYDLEGYDLWWQFSDGII